MGLGLELITGFTTGATAAFTGVTLAAGNSLTVRNSRLDARIMLLQLWRDVQEAAVIFRLRSPKLHDNVQGIRFPGVVGETQPLLPDHFMQRLFAQDQLVLEGSGATVAGDINTACLLVFYEDLQGIEGRFVSEAQLIERMVNLVTVNNTIAAGAGGGYSGEEAINAEFDLLKANTDYAIVGYTVSAECAAVRWRGPDTGNLGVGGPGSETDSHITASWFLRLARTYAMPLVPVINSANKGGTFIDVAQDENAAAVTVATILAELAPLGR